MDQSPNLPPVTLCTGGSVRGICGGRRLYRTCTRLQRCTQLDLVALAQINFSVQPGQVCIERPRGCVARCRALGGHGRPIRHRFGAGHGYRHPHGGDGWRRRCAPPKPGERRQNDRDRPHHGRTLPCSQRCARSVALRQSSPGAVAGVASSICADACNPRLVLRAAARAASASRLR